MNTNEWSTLCTRTYKAVLGVWGVPADSKFCQVSVARHCCMAVVGTRALVRQLSSGQMRLSIRHYWDSTLSFQRGADRALGPDVFKTLTRN